MRGCEKPDLSVQLAPSNPHGLLLKNPVMPAAGTFGYGVEYEGLVDVEKLGAVVSQGTTLLPRPGNPQPRLAELPFGILNSIGLENKGVDFVVREMAPIWSSWKTPVIVNIAGETPEEYEEVARRLEGVPGISAVEINISCPNVRRGGLEFGADPEAAEEVVRRVRGVFSLPVLVKLSAGVGDVIEIARRVERAGADAITITNTLRGMIIDVRKRKPVLGNAFGGLSGPAIKPLALYAVWRLYGEVRIPIVGCGGISSAQDALEFLMAGASAVQIGSAIFSNPGILEEVIEGIRDFLLREGISRLSELVGAAHR